MTLSLTLPPSAGTDQAPFCCQMVVGKALLNRPPPKQFSEGQLALESFLTKRRQKYQARRIDLAKHSCEENTCRSSALEKEINVHQRNSIIRLAALKDGPRPLIHPCRMINLSSPVQNTKETKLEDFSQLECEVLADRVVSRAKVRLKRRKKAANVLQKLYKPMSNSSHSKAPTFRTSTPTNSKSSTPKFLSPSKSVQRLNRSLEVGEDRQGLKVGRKVVYWSEKQSAMAKDAGVPSVPPPSPKPAEGKEAEDIKFVPSMSDKKSQTKLKHCLQAITVEEADKEQVRKMEKERREEREATRRLKAQQRAEIYALNKVMAEFERLKFEEGVQSGKV